jgi:hypothetical protein
MRGIGADENGQWVGDFTVLSVCDLDVYEVVVHEPSHHIRRADDDGCGAIIGEPDLDDAGTIGAIEHVLLPEAWPEHSIEVRRHSLGHEVFLRRTIGAVTWSSGWVPGHAVGQTLVHALEAAPERRSDPEDGVPTTREWRDSATEGYSSNARGHRPGDETDL